jgi:hypothetical protein
MTEMSQSRQKRCDCPKQLRQNQHKLYVLTHTAILQLPNRTPFLDSLVATNCQAVVYRVGARYRAFAADITAPVTEWTKSG